MNYDEVNEKYKDLAKEVTTNLIENLKELSRIEEKYSAYPKEERLELGRKYFELFREEYKIVVDKIGTEKIKESHYGGSIGSPTEYWYLSDSYEGTCIMKSPKKVVVEFSFKYGIAKKHQFTMKLVDEEYKLDSVKYGFPGEGKWYKMNI